MGICALYVFLSIVKHFEILKALYKFPIIIIIIIIIFIMQPSWERTHSQAPTCCHFLAPDSKKLLLLN